MHSSGACRLLVLVIACLAPAIGAAEEQPAASAAEQVRVSRVEQMPNIPQPFRMRDWRQVARDYDSLVFDLNAKGEYFPLVWIDRSRVNFDEDTFGLYVTMADPRCGPHVNDGQYHDAINDIPAVLSGTLVGIDKRRQGGWNWAGMLKAYFNRANGRNVFLQHIREFDAWKTGGGYNIDFWQVVFPNVAFFQLAHFYPNEPGFTELMRTVADRFHAATGILLSSPRGFGWSVFDFQRMTPVTNRITQKTGQPDTAAAFAWIQYMAYARFRDPKYLETAKAAMAAYHRERRNPRYELFPPPGAYLAARLNAELGLDYDVERLVNWCFDDDSYVWPGTQVLVKRFGEYDVSGLFAVRDRAYLMETFQMAGALVPLVRYDPRFARAIGKWMLNAANAARLFYPEELPDANQSAPEYKGLVRNVIAYEALTLKNGGPYAERDDWIIIGPDGKRQLFPKVSQFSLYNSSHAGFFGGIISRTNEEKILQLDCLKTDFFRDKAYPTYLYFNPHAKPKAIRVDAGERRVDLYDAVSKAFVKKNVRGATSVRLAADSAAVIVLVPTGAKLTRSGSRLVADGVVVDFAASKTRQTRQ